MLLYMKVFQVDCAIPGKLCNMLRYCIQYMNAFTVMMAKFCASASALYAQDTFLKINNQLINLWSINEYSTNIRFES